MKQLFLLMALMSYVLMSVGQQADEHAIRDEYIIQFTHNNNNMGKFFEGHGEINVLRCLSKHMGIYLVKSPVDLIRKYKDDEDVKVIQHNHNGITHRNIIPNDSLFNLQWNMLNTSTPGADISATQAWQLNHSNLTQAGDTIVVAVIDGGLGAGFDIYHPDINFFINHHEIPNNGIDDDGNGYIDDYLGWNIFGLNDSVNDNSDPHATHVSGIVGAKGNNISGVAGVTWGTKILAVNGASNTESDVIEAYDYVMEMRRLYDQTAGAKGAFVVATNSSFGIDMGQASQYPIWCAMYDSMGALGIISTAATANQAWNVDQLGDMPTTCPSKWLLAVTNTNRTDVLYSQAGYGPVNIDLGAPGTSILSTYSYDEYAYDAGTSMASPHVAGAVAGLMANACPALLNAYFAHPDSIALLLRTYLLESVDPLTTLQGNTASGGRLNLYHAFIAEDAYNCNNCNYNLSLMHAALMCNGDSTASIAVNTGAQAPHYLWSGGDTTAAITGLHAGYYQVTVTDSSGCQRQASLLITSPQPIVISSINVISINGNSPGNIIVSASAGNDSLSYAIDSSSYQSSAIFVMSVSGLHTIHIKNATGCVLDTVVGIYYTGISDIDAGQRISVYPNPSTGLFYFNGLTKGNTIEVYDMIGQSKLSAIAGLSNYTIDLSAQAKGVYFYRVSAQGGIVHQGKIVVE